MSSKVDILAVFRVEHPDMPLTETVSHDETATIRPVQEAGTDPARSQYLFSVTSEDLERFQAGLEADPTIEDYERLIQLEGEAIFAFTYAEEAIVFSSEVSRANGLVLDNENVGTSWIFKTWFPDRESVQRLWDHARERGITIDLDRINEHGSIVSGGSYGLTATQRNAILTALEAGYFDEPRGASLGEVAEQLDISQPAASGLLRRGIKRLVTSTVAEADGP